MSLEITNLHKRFGDTVALDGVTFRVEPGQVFGFLGANGAGKTTTMRIALDIIRADEGRVSWGGRDSTELPRRTWGYLPEERGLYPRMKVEEQLVFFAALYGVPSKAARAEVHEWLERFRVPEYAGRKAEELSKGNQQKVQFIAAVLHDPEVLVMDEPFAGLDPVNVDLLKDAFLEMRDRGKTLVFSTHQMEMVEELCDAVAIIDRGRLLANGPTAEVRRMTGKRVVRLGVVGDPDLPWLAGIAGTRITRAGRDYSEIEVADGQDPEALLHAAMERGERITRFEIADPSLTHIFIDLVGTRPDAEERTLAGPRAAGGTPPTGPGPGGAPPVDAPPGHAASSAGPTPSGPATGA
jgi:ABC-2 type transport system ATP-binding protein